MLAFVNPKLLSKTTRKILTYVPSAVFPAIIFPAVFLDKKGFFVSIENPQIWAFVVAVVAGYYFNHLHRLN
jgi:branched-subunit amino acid transport protein